MQGLELCSNDDVRLHLTPPPPPTTTSSASLSIDAVESAEERIQRLISENPVIIFSPSSGCSMCHVMRKLLATIGVNPTVIELDDEEICAVPQPPPPPDDYNSSPPPPPNRRIRQLSSSLFIGGACVGGLESLVALHLSGLLVPKLLQVGAL